MRTFLVIIVVAVVACAASFTAVAQQAPQQQPQRGPASQDRPIQLPLPDIHKAPAVKFIGTWEGTATHHRPGQAEPDTVRVTETAEWKLGETAIFIQGRGVMTDADTGEETVVHDALGIIRIDPATHKLMFYGFKAGEPANESVLEILDNGDMRWFMRPAPNVLIRFTISITEDSWTEIGEFSRDGGVNYFPILQMNLKRVK